MMQQRNWRRMAFVLASCATVALGGCDTVGDWFGSSKAPPLPGKRVAVMTNESRITPDSNVSAGMNIGTAMDNASWAQPGGGPEHAPGHLALSSTPREAWRADIGSGSSSNLALLGVPVVADGRLATIDADSKVSLFDARTGARLWSVSVRPEQERGDSPGGGVSLNSGRVYVGSGYAEVLALDAANGAVIWRKKVSGPVRGAPTVADGRVFALTLDNQVMALSAADGALLWTHSGIIESAGLLGGNSPATTQGLVVAPYSSGEVFGLRPENGRVVWNESLASLQVRGALGALSDIRGLPVIDRGIVFAVSHSGRLMAVDERLGGRLWDRDIGSSQTPYVAGDHVFVVTNDSQVVALERRTGLIRWVSQLQRYRRPDDRIDPVVWAGPVLAGERLWLTNSLGQLVGLQVDNGKPVYDAKLSDKTFLPPVVAGGMMYVLSDNGTLTAFR